MATVKFRVRFVDDLPGRQIAIHALTPEGRRRGLAPHEILIDRSMRPYRDILVLHEAVEYQLQARGWSYRRAHRAALQAERETFGHLARYARFLGEVGSS